MTAKRKPTRGGAREGTRKKKRYGQRRNKVLLQALNTMILLRRGRWTIDEIADELGIHWRTMYRIVNGLREVGVPVEVQQEPGEPGAHRGFAYYRVPAEGLRKLLRL